jgi:hypothetical protein
MRAISRSQWLSIPRIVFYAGRAFQWGPGFWSAELLLGRRRKLKVGEEIYRVQASVTWPSPVADRVVDCIHPNHFSAGGWADSDSWTGRETHFAMRIERISLWRLIPRFRLRLQPAWRYP